jgi:hypothetical protein
VPTVCWREISHTGSTGRYEAADTGDALIAGRWFGMLVCYLREGSRVFETYWCSGRASEAWAPQLRPPRLDGVRPAGDLGGLSCRLASAIQDER